MSASSSQRMLSLWLRRLSTDRIARSREVSAPLVIYGKRGNAELIVAVDAVIGEMRPGGIVNVAVRRLSLAAADSGTLALLLRAAPPNDASTAATRWIVGGAPSVTAHGPGAARFDAQLVRNRRGPVGSWILEWSNSDERFILATHAQPVAAPALDRPYRQVA